LKKTRWPEYYIHHLQCRELYGLLIRRQVRLETMPQRSVDLKVSLRLIGAIKRMQFAFSIDQPTSMPNALSAAECYSGGSDDAEMIPRERKVIFAALRSSPSL
jgi:hypothetical protein